MAQRICMVTGASSGIGKETSRKLAELGATVVMASRNQKRGVRAISEIKGANNNAQVELMLADFASLDSVRALVKEFLEKHDSLHVLVNNAGGVRVTRSVTSDGFETTFQVDYLSHFLLTNLLLEVLKKSAPSRIINVSSASHYRGHMNFDDLQLKKGYGVMKAYSQAKLAQVLFTYELSRRLEGTGVTVNSLHPGAVATNLWKGSLGPFSFLGNISRLFLISPEKGAEAPVYLTSSSEVEGVTGKYYDRMREKQSSAESHDQAAARKLWDESERMTGLST
ncbi:MAG TPA: SDR family oxidoreductase [Nitrososphaerales archaeon]|nr:SDR family oxidoreductase [Nitrososphaerales archaeon]